MRSPARSASGSGTVKLDGTAYTVISGVNGLEAVNNNLAGNYVLGADIGDVMVFGDVCRFGINRHLQLHRQRRHSFHRQLQRLRPY